MSEQPDPSQRWIEFEGQRYYVHEGQTALDSMLSSGARIFFSCRKGTCRSCMLESISGDPGQAGLERLPENLRSQGMFLPCVTTNPCNVRAQMPDKTKMATRCMLQDKTRIGPDIWKFVLESETTLSWRAGQYVSVRSASGAMRSYSIVTRPDEYFVELHIRHYPDGAVSNALVAETEIGDTIEIVGPVGNFYYASGMAAGPLLLAGTGVAAGVLLAVARDALEQGHSLPVHLVHGGRHAGDHYLREAMAETAAQFPQFTFDLAPFVDDAAFAEHVLADAPQLASTTIFLCGAPSMVEVARIEAMRNGARLASIRTDPFESPIPYAPRDAAKIAAFPPDPEFWAALDEGRLLTKILDGFYTRAMADPRLGPFFHKVTKDRLVGKQYSFTSDLLLGKANYFGERPFNAHHWMIISDELFDYREEMFFEVVREFGLAPKFQARWAALNEMFRREIVKAAPRGQWLGGSEHFKPDFETEQFDIAMICDGCQREIPARSPVRHHVRTGEAFCADCVVRATTPLSAMEQTE